MAASRVRHAETSDLQELVEMRLLLWPDSSLEEQRKEAETCLSHGMSGTLPVTILVASTDDGMLTGFLEVGLRSHADGCDTARPVGYIEGWFVRESFRGRGVGGELMSAAEDWSRTYGCLEIASDALIDNRASEDAHCALGFEVVDRCVHLRKGL